VAVGGGNAQRWSVVNSAAFKQPQQRRSVAAASSEKQERGTLARGGARGVTSVADATCGGAEPSGDKSYRNFYPVIWGDGSCAEKVGQRQCRGHRQQRAISITKKRVQQGAESVQKSARVAQPVVDATCQREHAQCERSQ
jgi:hypothetical protein